jgi:hypothetical protein
MGRVLLILITSLKLAGAARADFEQAKQRPICTDCEPVILAAGAMPASACRSGNVY